MRPMSLRTAWEQRLARASDAASRSGAGPNAGPSDWLYGKPGWSLAMDLPEIIEPFLTTAPSLAGDLAYFAGLGADAAATLLRCLPADQFSDRQNAAPPLGVLLRAAAANEHAVELHGYLVGPDRPDERLTADGIYLFQHEDFGPGEVQQDLAPGDVAAAVWRLARSYLEVDESFSPPDELSRVRAWWRPGTTAWQLWWD